MTTHTRNRVALLALVALTRASAAAGEAQTYSPFLGDAYAKDVYWGDTHLHTSNSFDAGFANFRVGPEEAFRFARGEAVTASGGMNARLIRPLDFLVVSDHAEYLGLAPALRDSDPKVLANEASRGWHDALQSGDEQRVFETAMAVIQGVAKRDEQFEDPEFVRSVWQSAADTADAMNAPGVFTAFAGFEWTSMPGGNNLHRVVLFADDSAKTKQVVPYSLFDSEDPEDLWRYMAAYEERTGGNVLAIPHNGNVSNGQMFAVEAFDGRPFTKAYAEARSRWEPLVEVTQIKGDGEAHPALSPNDEFADYGTWDKGNLIGLAAKAPGMLQYEYARSALKLGLDIESQLGVNPFRFGMIGSTDSHTGLATAREDNFFGKHSGAEPNPERAVDDVLIVSPIDEALTTWGWEQVASGLAAVWATENTRTGIFDAMERKETYATTGSRIRVRFFGGWDFRAEDLENPLPAREGYARGVPMGGELSRAPDGGAPTFMVWALRDPEGANLDRVQIVKGWRSGDGRLEEKVVDVAWSGTREPGADGKLPAVGSTADVPSASYTNAIGAPILSAVWRDPDFDAAERAFYYARVIEIPTPRWTAYDARFFDTKLADAVEMTTQERAYTSPVWYSPAR